ncbi:MAG TPA: DUF6247 family protein [Actinomycetota bacterium]|nr:DUF6247 family protein [Actinomycetota bacterium]
MTSIPDRIVRPEELGLPSEAREVFDRLTTEGARAFSRDIVQALLEAQARGNLRPVRDVVDAWYRTLQFVQQPHHDEAVAWAGRDDGPDLDREDLERQLGL